MYRAKKTVSCFGTKTKSEEDELPDLPITPRGGININAM